MSEVPTALDVLQAADTVFTNPNRVVIIKDPGESFQEVMPAFLNPASLRETLTAEWNRLPVIGLDHEIPHYSRTKSIEIPLSFYFSAFEAARRANAVENTREKLNAERAPLFQRRVANALSAQVATTSMDFANFFRSLVFPTSTGLRPPPVKVIWPYIFEMVGVITSVTFDYMKFDRSAAPVVYKADINFLETRVTRRFSERVRAFGLEPDGAGPNARTLTAY